MNRSVGRRRQKRAGRIVAVAASTNGAFDLDQTFTQTFALTDLGKLDHQTYPSLAGIAPDRTVYNTYSNGFLTSVGPNYATAITYWPNGLMATVTHANGVTDSQALDPNAMARPASISTSGARINGAGGGDWSTGTYGYDGVGNIAAMTRSPSDNDTFTYDLVSRLKTAAVTGSDRQHTQTAGFDAVGNVTSLTADGSPTGPDLTTTPATNHLANATYDGAGNLTAWNSASYGWDGFNQLQTVQGTGIARYNGYSAEGERVLMRDQNTTTITLRGLDNKVLRDITYDPTAAAGQQWRWAKDYVYRDGSLLASVSATDGLRHYALDHLGTPRLATDRCGERKKLFAYLPFGQEVPAPTAGNPQDKERMRFTVHERDLGLLDTGADDLDYMHARTYGPVIGRFLSTDPMTGTPQRPQSWNLFTYVSNNPITHTDPTGKCIWDACAVESGIAAYFAGAALIAAGTSYVIAHPELGEQLGSIFSKRAPGPRQLGREGYQTQRQRFSQSQKAEPPPKEPDPNKNPLPPVSAGNPQPEGWNLPPGLGQVIKFALAYEAARAYHVYSNFFVGSAQSKPSPPPEPQLLPAPPQPESARDKIPEITQHYTFQMQQGPVTNQ